MSENQKTQRVCNLLLKAIRETPAGSNIVDMRYDPARNAVVILWDDAHSVTAQAADGGLQMIRNIVSSI